VAEAVGAADFRAAAAASAAAASAAAAREESGENDPLIAPYCTDESGWPAKAQSIRSYPSPSVESVVVRNFQEILVSFFFKNPPIDHARVVAAIGAAEAETSGEIRILLARHKADDPVAAAQKHFERLGMTQTKERNGVLIFLAPRSRTFAVIGDTAIHEKCGDAFWTELTAAMTEHFKRADFTAGLVHGIGRAGALLAEHFPRQSDDRNELPDKIEEAD
jgi:uncharacterized membrane protein